MQSVVSGGKFGHGFIGAGAAQFAAPGISTIGKGAKAYRGVRVAVAGIVGGATSSALGGNFAAGAFSAAFARQFNDEKHIKEQNSGEKRRAERKRIAGRGSSVLPELEPGRYLIVVDSISTSIGAAGIQTGEMWIIDKNNNQHLNFGVIGLEGGYSVGGSVSRQFGALSVSSSANVEGISVFIESTAIVGFGGKGALIPTDTSFNMPHATGGFGLGFEAGKAFGGNYTWFKKAYDFNNSPLLLSP